LSKVISSGHEFLRLVHCFTWWALHCENAICGKHDWTKPCYFPFTRGMSAQYCCAETHGRSL